MNTHVLRALFALLAALVLVLGVTACGGDDDEVDDGNGEAAVTETSPPVNFDFEDDTAGWVVTGKGVTIERSTKQARSGKASMEVVTPGAERDEGALMTTGSERWPHSPNQGSSGPRVLVEPGETYTATAWVRAPAGSKMNFIIRERTASGSSVGTTDVDVEPTGDWQRVEATGTFDTGEYITVELRPAATQDITFHVDDVKIRRERGQEAGD